MDVFSCCCTLVVSVNASDVESFYVSAFDCLRSESAISIGNAIGSVNAIVFARMRYAADEMFAAAVVAAAALPLPLNSSHAFDFEIAFAAVGSAISHCPWWERRAVLVK